MNWITGLVKVEVCEKLPVDEVDVIIGKELAGGKVFTSPIVTKDPLCDLNLVSQYPEVFPVCAVTRSQSSMKKLLICLIHFVRTDPTEFELSVPMIRMGRTNLAAAQKADFSLSTCLSVAVPDKSVLMHKWNSMTEM